jgi:methyl-accepting chemotaxis protein
MNSLKITYRLIILVGIMICLLAVLSTFSIRGLGTTAKGMETIYLDRVVPLEDLKIIADLYAINIVDTSHQVRNSNFTWLQGTRNINEAQRVIEEKWEAYLATFLVEDEIRLVKEAKPLLVKANTSIAKLLDIMGKQDMDALTQYTIDELYDAIDPISGKFSELVGVQLTVAKREYDAGQALYQSTLNFTIGLLVFGTLGLILIAIYIIRSITQPLRSMYEAAKNLESGDGDLTSRIPNFGNNELGETSAAFNGFIEKLQNLLIEVKGSIYQIADSAEQVTSTSQILSSSSNQLASSVEETSSSLEEMNSSIAQNTENAKMTEAIATQSANEAGEGGAAVSETVKAMAEIADKISIIEDIAYKTNLLALNAAIEAARAGEHGKGFAVVADEVRKLAERSQSSAQEISNLAGNSVKVAERAGGLLDSMVPNIRKTADLVQEITSASSEQAQGVNEVNSAMNQLDQVAQQNASASEQLSSTAQLVSDQSSAIIDTISIFNLGDDSKRQQTKKKAPSHGRIGSAAVSSQHDFEPYEE